jgi:hypothetical protein
MMTRALPIVAAVLFILSAPAAQAAGPAPPSLTGEAFITSGLPARGVSQATGTCTPTGDSSYTFHVEGEAIGPYTGTYVENGSFTIASSFTPMLTAFNSTFTVTSGAGTVTGTKTLAADLGPVNVATCGIATGFVPNDPNSVNFQATTRYTANLPGGAVDSGHAVVTYQDLQIRDLPDLNTFNFVENFYSDADHSKTDGGGRVAPDVSFGFEANSDGPKGRCSVVDHTTGTQVKCLDVTSYTRTDNAVVFGGHATVNGVATTYTIQVEDGGEPGGSDAFSIQTGNGYAAGGTLMDGNVQVHA